MFHPDLQKATTCRKQNCPKQHRCTTLCPLEVFQKIGSFCFPDYMWFGPCCLSASGDRSSSRWRAWNHLQWRAGNMSTRKHRARWVGTVAARCSVTECRQLVKFFDKHFVLVSHLFNFLYKFYDLITKTCTKILNGHWRWKK